MSGGRPVALLTPGFAAAHGSFVVRFAGRRSFGVTIVITAPGGRRLWQTSREEHPGPASLRVALPKADTRHGRFVVLTARFTVGGRSITLRAVIRFR